VLVNRLDASRPGPSPGDSPVGRAGACRRRFGVAAGHALAFVLLSLGLVASARGASEADLAGQPIVSVEFQGLRTLSEETLRYYLAIEPGTTFDPAALDRNIHELWDRHLLDDISVEAAPTPGGVHLLLRVTERPVLRSVEYDGLKKLGHTDIQDRIDKEQIRLREGGPLDLGEIERLKAELVKMYAEKGYRFATVEYTLEEVGTGERKVRFTVDEGTKVKIGKIHFEGNTVFSDRRLRLTMRKTKESGFISRLLKHDIYNPATIEEDLGKVRDLYREKGYKNVDAGEPRVEVKARYPEAPPKRQKRRLELTIPVVEGDRWKFGNITIEGNKVFTDEQLLRAFARPRSPWLRASAVDKGVKAIEELYRNSGYIYSQVDVELQERPDNVADVVVKVFEGDQFKVGRIEFKGNDRTRDKVLRREFRVHEGTVLNMGALKNSIYKLNQLTYFKIDEDNPIEFENIDREAKTVDLTVNGTESDRTELLFGGGWSELDGFFGQFSMQTQNFLGRGESLGVSLQTGKVRDIYEVSYFVPWMFDRPQSAGLQLFKRDLDYNLLDTQNQVRKEKGGVVTYGRSFGLFQSARLQYELADIRDQVTFLDTTTSTTSTSVSRYSKSDIRPVWYYDSLDNRLEPTVGLRTSASLEYAGGALGGDINLWRPEVSLTWFRPVARRPVRSVFATNFEAGWVQDHGTKGGLPLLERYYIGGSRSVRGFASRTGITLRDDHDQPVLDKFGNILGGTSYLQASLEYHLLLGGPFRLVFFVDGGNVYGAEGRQFDSLYLRSSAGAELRLFVPVFGLPLRFIYAKNLRPLPDDRFESFQFDVGTSF
jgi:outer membrane protein insertion porin family